MQEKNELMVEVLCGQSGLEAVYDRLGLRDHVDKQLGMMEDVEFAAVHDHAIEMLEAGKIGSSVDRSPVWAIAGNAWTQPN